MRKDAAEWVADIVMWVIRLGLLTVFLLVSHGVRISLVTIGLNPTISMVVGGIVTISLMVVIRLILRRHTGH